MTGRRYSVGTDGKDQFHEVGFPVAKVGFRSATSRADGFAEAGLAEPSPDVDQITELTRILEEASVPVGAAQIRRLTQAAWAFCLCP